MEETLQKLVDLLIEKGVDEELVKSAVAEVEGKDKEIDDEENKVVDEEKHDDETPAPVEDENKVDEEDVKPVVDDEQVVEGKELDEKVAPDTVEDTGFVPPAPEDVVPPVEEENNALPEGLEEVNPNADVQPDVPAVDYALKIEEQNKLIEGLTARIGSLEEALKKGGILFDEADNEGQPIGVDESKVPANLDKDNPNGLEDFMAQINRRNRF